MISLGNVDLRPMPFSFFGIAPNLVASLGPRQLESTGNKIAGGTEKTTRDA
jgi:hypothetical protein